MFQYEWLWGIFNEGPLESPWCLKSKDEFSLDKEHCQII